MPSSSLSDLLRRARLARCAWGLMACLAAAQMGALWRADPAAGGLPRSVFSRSAFLARASALDAPGRAKARAYVQAIDHASTLPLDAFARANAAASRVAPLFGYASDEEVWGAPDHWATPIEFLGKGQGDCEDFAIASFFMLLASGWPPDRARLAYANLALPEGPVIAHVVLLVLGDAPGDAWVVDNTRAEATLLSTRDDLQVLFSFDRSDVYVAAGDAWVGSSRDRLRNWRRVLDLTDAEGFR